MEFSDEFLTFRVTTPGNNQFMGFLPIVYASPDWKKRKKLWRDLTNFNVNHVTPRDPWLVIGDFNSIVSMSEKKGGRVDPFVASARDFQGFYFGITTCPIWVLWVPLSLGVTIGWATTASLKG